MVRRFRYYEERLDRPVADYSAAELDDSAWPVVTRSFGPRYQVLEPLPLSAERDTFEEELLSGTAGPEAVQIDGRRFEWRFLGYSDRYGIEDDPLLTSMSGFSIHGPIGWVPDDQVHLPGDGVHAGDAWYLRSSLGPLEPDRASISVGTAAALRVWVGGREMIRAEAGAEGISREGPWRIADYPRPEIHAAELPPAGQSVPIVVRLVAQTAHESVRFFAFAGCGSAPPVPTTDMPSGDQEFVPEGIVATEWYKGGCCLPVDVHAQSPPRALWYRMTTPPGGVRARFLCHGRPSAWLNGKPVATRPTESSAVSAIYEGAQAFELVLTDHEYVRMACPRLRLRQPTRLAPVVQSGAFMRSFSP